MFSKFVIISIIVNTNNIIFLSSNFTISMWTSLIYIISRPQAPNHSNRDQHLPQIICFPYPQDKVKIFYDEAILNPFII